MSHQLRNRGSTELLCRSPWQHSGAAVAEPGQCQCGLCGASVAARAETAVEQRRAGTFDSNASAAERQARRACRLHYEPRPRVDQGGRAAGPPASVSKTANPAPALRRCSERHCSREIREPRACAVCRSTFILFAHRRGGDAMADGTPAQAAAAEPPAQTAPAAAAEPHAPKRSKARAVVAEPRASTRPKSSPNHTMKKPMTRRGPNQPGAHAAKRGKRTPAASAGPLHRLRDATDKFDLDSWLHELLAAGGYARNPLRTKLRLVTGCSGTGSPTVVTQSMLGPDCVEELFASERNQAAALFLIRSCQPEHVFMDMRDAVDSQYAPCFVHAGRACLVPTQEEDLFVCGFVCKDNSPQNPARFKRDPVKDQGVSDHMDTYYASVEHIKQRKPRVALLENVWHGLVMTRGKEGAGSVMDFILKDPTWGLETLDDYTTSVVQLRGTDCSMPMIRARCFFVLVRNGADFTSKTVIDIHARLMHGIQPGIYHAKSFVLPSEHAIVQDWHAKQAKGIDVAPAGGLDECAAEAKYSSAMEKAFRLAVNAKRLPADWTLTPLIRRPSTVHGLRSLPPFLRANIDVYSDIIEVAVRAGSGNPPCRLADVSQTVSRGRTTLDGTVPTLTTSSRIFDYDAGRFWTPSELLSVHGFPVQINVGGLTWPEATALAGNGMILPAVGSIAAAILVALGFYTQVPPGG